MIRMVMAMTNAVLLSAMVLVANCHSFITFPMPISKVETCRIGGNPGWEAFCGGPCPDYNFRYDMRPENPAATWQRGSYQTIHYSKNNHEGGFVRLTLVPLDEIMRREAHDALAFHYGCWSTGQYTCSDKEKHRDCGYDLDNLAYKIVVHVPTVYPDGVYVLGWTWYGGGTVTSDFGDYYDCSFVRIQGGELSDTYQAVFESNDGNGCQASVDRLGLCTTEPCFEWPEKKYDSSRKIPAPFLNGTPQLYREWLERAQKRAANQVRVAEEFGEFAITAFSIYDTGSEQRLDVNVDEVIDISGLSGITIVPEYYGNVEWVEWVVNGELESTKHTWPYSIGGEQPHEHDPTRLNFYDWPFPVLDKRVFVTAIAHSGDNATFFSKDLYFVKHW